MATSSRLVSISTDLIQFVKVFCSNSINNRTLIRKPRDILWIVVSLWFMRHVSRLVYNAFFHPLSRLPGNNIIASSYLPVAAATLCGRAQHLLPLFHKRYGKVVRIGTDLVSVADKDMIREILVRIDLPRTEVIHRAFDFDGQQNLFSTRSKDLHKARRRHISPAFSLKHLCSLEPILHECTQILLQKIDEIVSNPGVVKHGTVLPKGHIDIGYLSICFSVDIIGELVFGKTFQMVKEGTHPVPELLAKTLKGCALYHFAPWLRYILPPLDFSFFDFIYMKIAERNASSSKGKLNILHHLLNAQQKEGERGSGETGDEYEDMVSEKLTDKAIATECAVFLAAGADTAASIMGYTLMFLAKNPVKLARLREEIDFATANNDDGALPFLDQISRLPYFNACINETLRIHPILPTGIPREVNEDMTINGYFFPKGTILLANYPQLHWSEEYFSQAHKFIPERWLPSESPFPPVIDKVFYPFSAGAKNCIGKGFAMMSLRLALAALVLNYDMERATPELDDDIFEASSGPDQGTCIIRMERRRKAPYIMRSDSGTSMTSI